MWTMLVYVEHLPYDMAAAARYIEWRHCRICEQEMHV